MPKEDYLQKYLEKLNRVIAAMLGLLEKENPEEALRVADEIYIELLNVDLEKLGKMNATSFELELMNHKNAYSHLEGLAEILYQTANAYWQTGNNEMTIAFNKKALQTYLYLTRNDKTFSFERDARISELIEKTNNK